MMVLESEDPSIVDRRQSILDPRRSDVIHIATVPVGLRLDLDFQGYAGQAPYSLSHHRIRAGATEKHGDNICLKVRTKCHIVIYN